MNYAEAVAACMAGKYLTRSIWKDQSAYMVFLHGLSCFIRVKTNPAQDVSPWLAAIDDSLADDWMEFVIDKASEVVENVVEKLEEK